MDHITLIIKKSHYFAENRLEKCQPNIKKKIQPTLTRQRNNYFLCFCGKTPNHIMLHTEALFLFYLNSSRNV